MRQLLQLPHCHGNQHNKVRVADLQAHNSVMISMPESVRVPCVGWAVWERFKNSPALVFLEDWHLNSGHMQKISEMNQDTVCSAKGTGCLSPWNIFHTHSGAGHMYCPRAENIITSLVFIHVLVMGNKTTRAVM